MAVSSRSRDTCTSECLAVNDLGLFRWCLSQGRGSLLSRLASGVSAASRPHRSSWRRGKHEVLICQRASPVFRCCGCLVIGGFRSIRLVLAEPISARKLAASGGCSISPNLFRRGRLRDHRANDRCGRQLDDSTQRHDLWPGGIVVHRRPDGVRNWRRTHSPHDGWRRYLGAPIQCFYHGAGGCLHECEQRMRDRLCRTSHSQVADFLHDGRNWAIQTSGTTENLNSVSFVDANTGTVVGWLGTILRTPDGGRTWAPQSSGTTLNLDSVSFGDADTGTAVATESGGASTFFQTRDGGETWSSLPSGTRNLAAVSMLDANIGAAVGYSGRTLKTEDGGNSWTELSRNAIEVYRAYGVAFVDPDTGWVVGGGTIIHTSDGGNHWTTQYDAPSLDLRAIGFVDANTGTAVGTGGTILRTTDGGATWVRQSSGTGAHLYGVSFIDAATGTAVGIAGWILRTDDGGETWTRQFTGTLQSLFAVSMLDANTGIAVGDSGTILRSSDGGATWTPRASGTSNALLGLSFVDANIGTAVGDGILRTTDGGETWTRHTGTGHAVSFVDANNGMIAGYGPILRTTDGGATWIAQCCAPADSYWGVHMLDINTATAVGDNGRIMRTNTGGW